MPSPNSTRRLRGLCLGAGYFSRFQYEAWQRIPELEIVGVAPPHCERLRRPRRSRPIWVRASRSLRWQTRHTFGLVRVDGGRGHLELDLEGNLTLKLLGQPARRIDYPHTREGFAGDCVYALQRHFVDRMLDGAPFENTGEDYLRSTALMEACYRSHATGQVVTLPTSL